MPKFESPITGKNIPARPFKEYDIPDETDYKEPPMEYGEPVVRKHPPHNIDFNAIQEFQNKLNTKRMPVMEDDDDKKESKLEQEMRQARADKRAGIQRLNDGAKRRIEILIGMTRSTREVEIDGNKFVLQSLKSKEMRDAINISAEYDGTVQSPFEIRKQFLSRSLIQIAGIDVSQFIGSDSLEDKLEFIDELDDELLTRLYNEFLELRKEAQNKYSMKTDEEVKEVLEDLKK